VKRGELYLVEKASRSDTKKQRVYVIVSRQALIDSNYSNVICAPVYTTNEGLSTQVSVGIEEGLKHPSCIRCDELISIQKAELTHYIGTLSNSKLKALKKSLRIALSVE
jgi:mRNA interferase MazF